MLIGTRKIDPVIIARLVKDIKKKKGLFSLADDFVEAALKKYLSQNPKKISFLCSPFSERSENYKKTIKEVRKELRKVHGLYLIPQESKEREKYFQDLIKTDPHQKEFLELHKKILSSHSSSKERSSFYKEFYHQLFKITGKPKTLLDLGCGLNPFSFPFMKLKKLTIYAYDINEEEAALLQNYFNFLKKTNPNFSGEAKVLNLSSKENLKELKPADLCFLWKMTDVLDRDNCHITSEEVITKVPSPYVIVSFPTFTVKGLPMNQPRRKWIELMCRRLKYSYQIIKEKNEIFYVIKK